METHYSMKNVYLVVSKATPPADVTAPEALQINIRVLTVDVYSRIFFCLLVFRRYTLIYFYDYIQGMHIPSLAPLLFSHSKEYSRNKRE